MSTYLHPAQKLKALSPRKKQLWVVAYVNQPKESPVSQADLNQAALADVRTSFEGGADAVVLINEWCALDELEGALASVRARFPSVKLGVNYLGDAGETYGWKDSFRLARQYD
ncbi:MAG: hypothetical protein AAB425_04560, partial [Bdellovibrionota bacterium]